MNNDDLSYRLQSEIAIKLMDWDETFRIARELISKSDPRDIRRDYIRELEQAQGRNPAFMGV
jgi:hypothetical protein